MKFVKVLERLSNACGVAGREDEVRVLMKDLLKPNVDDVQEDRLGNVIGVRRGRNDSPKVMVAAHMDEIGLMVKNVTAEG
ncbi:MAG: M42 family peptidase, partial [Candidatus Bathyarchaeia archaeon]